MTEGRVRVNGQTVTRLGATANPRKDQIEVDGRLVEEFLERLYFVLHKPPGVVSTLKDPEGRRTVRDLLSSIQDRIFPIGRLDYESSGLLLLTNDGALTAGLLHPRFQIPRIYQAKVAGTVTNRTLSELRRGIRLDDGHRTAPAKAQILRSTAKKTWVEISLTEGRNREIRRMFQALGNRVEKLIRVKYGPIILDIPIGHYRPLAPREIKQIKRLVENTAQLGS